MLVHPDVQGRQGTDEKFSFRQNGVDILFQGNVAGFAGVVDNAGAGSLRSQLHTLHHGPIFFRVVHRGFRIPFSLVCGGFFFPKGIFQILVQRLDGIVLGRGGLLFHRLKINIHRIALFQRRQQFVFCVGIVIFGPAGGEDGHTFQNKFLQISHGNVDFRLGCHAFFPAEHRHKAAHNSGIHLLFLFGQVLDIRNLQCGGQGGVGFNLAVVKNGFSVPESNRIPQLFHLGKHLFHLVLFCRGQVFGVGTGIGKVAGFIQFLDRFQRVGHGHFVFFAQHILQGGKGIQFARGEGSFPFLDVGYHRPCGIILPADFFCLAFFLFFELLFADKLDFIPFGFSLAHRRKIVLRHKITDGQIPVINGFHTRDNHPSHPQQGTGLHGGIPGQVHPVQPVNVGPGKPLIGQVVIFPFFFQVLQCGPHRLRGLVRQPQACQPFAGRGRQGVLHTQPNDDFPFTVCVSRIDDFFHVLTVAQRFQNAELLGDAAVA